MPAVWITLSEVESLARVSGFSPGTRAFVTICVTAESESEATAYVRDALRQVDFHLINIDEIESWESRRQSPNVPPDLEEMVAECQNTAAPVVGTFHWWRNQG